MKCTSIDVTACVTWLVGCKVENKSHIGSSTGITRYGSTLYIGIAMVVPIPQYIRKCQFLLSVSSEFDF